MKPPPCKPTELAMKPLFTVHAGEFLVADYIQRNFKHLNVWIPAKDIGVDLLVTNQNNSKSVSLQVKFSRDFSATHDPDLLRGELRASGWWSLNRQKLETSTADYWVFVLIGFAHRSEDYIVINPKELISRLQLIHGCPEIFQSYLCVTRHEKCWERRGLKKAQISPLAADKFFCKQRDFSNYLNNWQPVGSLTQ